MLTNVFQAVAGIITEPVKGAKKGGIKGGAVGFGKGILGLVCKPVKGTIDLVTQTTRGISNTPSAMYVGLSKMGRRVTVPHHHAPTNNPNEPTEELKALDDLIDPNIDIFMGEQNGENIYLNKKALKNSIKHS